MGWVKTFSIHRLQQK